MVTSYGCQKTVLPCVMCAQKKACWTQILHWNITTHIVNVGGRDHTCGWSIYASVTDQGQIYQTGLVQLHSAHYSNGLANWSLSLTITAIVVHFSALHLKWPAAQLNEESFWFLPRCAPVFIAQNNWMQWKALSAGKLLALKAKAWILLVRWP